VPKQQPTLIKVGSKGAYVNLNNTVSLGIVKDQPHTKLKDGFDGDVAKATPEDHVQFKADTASFYFLGRDELVLRVGMECSQEEFDNIEKIVDEVAYHARVPATDETA